MAVSLQTMLERYQQTKQIKPAFKKCRTWVGSMPIPHFCTKLVTGTCGVCGADLCSFHINQKVKFAHECA